MELPAFIMDPIGDIFGSIEGIAFGIMAIIAIGGALGTVYSKRVAHSMLSLIMCFFAVAGVFLLANAEMLAAIQILVLSGQRDAGLCFRCDVVPSPNHGGGFRMRLVSTFARLGIVGLLGLLLAVLMDPANWDPVTGPDSMTTLEFATAVLDDWAFTLVVLGALLAMAMAGAAYLVRDERKTNLMWELHGGEEE